MDAAMSKNDEYEYSLGGRFLAPLWRFLSRFVIDVTPNPTKNWIPDPKAELTLDLDSGMFSGVRFGDPYEALSFMGPCDSFDRMTMHCVDPEGNELGKPEKSYSLSYRTRGMSASADKNRRLDAFLLYFRPDRDQPGSTTYVGKMIWNGALVDHANLRNVDSIISVFGIPDLDNEEPEGDDPEIGKYPYRRVLIYEKPSAMLMIEVDKSGSPQGIYASKPQRAVEQQADTD